MKNRHFNNLLIALLALFILNACSLDDGNDPGIIIDPVEYAFENGIFVVNEGQFPNPGTIDFITSDLKFTVRDIFSQVNGEKTDLGGGLQSMFFDDADHAYIISNVGNFITVVNRYTFEMVGRIDTGLSVPRYGVVVADKAYITNQGDFMTNEDDYVAVINLEDYTLEEKITVGGPAEHIFDGANGHLYVEGAAYGIGNQVFDLDLAATEITELTRTEEELSSIVLDESALYALTVGKLQQFNLHTGDLENTVDLPSEQAPGKLRLHEGKLYYTVGTAVYSIPVTLENVGTIPVLTYESDSDFGAMYGFEVHQSKIFVAEGGDFASDSFVRIYDLEGNLLEEAAVGVGPNGFYFND